MNTIAERNLEIYDILIHIIERKQETLYDVMTIFCRLGTNVKELQWQPERVYLYDNNPVTLPDVAGVACGGRHSMVWLSNGNVFSFGNNFHAQLGYDYRSKNYKENQVNMLKLYITFVLSRDWHGSFIR